MKKVFLFLLSLFLIVIQSIPVLANYKSLSSIPIPSEEPIPEITAQSAIVINADTGEILYDKNSTTIYYPASITKLMTILLALEADCLEDTITFSYDAIFTIERNSSHIALDVDEVLPFKDALYAIMLVSANEASNGVAEHVGGSMEEFAKMMTNKASSLGARSTNFKNANGLHDKDHYTTAYDMALISKELLKYDIFKEIISEKLYVIEPTNRQSERRELYSQNKMLYMSSPYYYENCIGAKSGYTDQASNTLVTFAEKDNMTLISVILKDDGLEATYKDTATILDYCFNNYRSLNLFDINEYSGNLKAGEEDIPLKAEKSYTATIPKSIAIEEIGKNINVNTEVKGEVKANDTVGQIKLTYKDKTISSIPILAQKSYSPSLALAKENKNENEDFSFIFLLTAFSASFYVFITARRESRKRKYAENDRYRRRRKSFR